MRSTWLRVHVQSNRNKRRIHSKTSLYSTLYRGIHTRNDLSPLSLSCETGVEDSIFRWPCLYDHGSLCCFSKSVCFSRPRPTKQQLPSRLLDFTLQCLFSRPPLTSTEHRTVGFGSNAAGARSLRQLLSNASMACIETVRYV